MDKINQQQWGTSQSDDKHRHGVSHWTPPLLNVLVLASSLSLAGCFGGKVSVKTVSVEKKYDLYFEVEPGASPAIAGRVPEVPPVIVARTDAQEGIAGKTVTLSAYTDSSCKNPVTGVLTGTSGQTGSDGSVAFSGLSYSKAETIYFKASVGSIQSECSVGSMVVTPAEVASIGFSIQPGGSNVVAGSILTTQPAVYAKDAFDNLVPNAEVSLAAYSDSSCQTLASGAINNALTTTNAQGVAHFTTLSFQGAQTIYLKATSSSASVCSTASVSYIPGSVASIAYTVQPGGVGIAAGAAFSTQPAVLVKDVYQNLIPQQSVVLSVYSDSQCQTPVAGTLSGGTADSNGSGVATFTSAAFNKTATLYVKASAGGQEVCSSGTVQVVPASIASLSFSTQPGGTGISAGAVFATPPAVVVKDAHDNLISGASVTLSPFSESSCGTGGAGTLASASSTSGSNGIAEFPNLNYSLAGTVYLKAIAAAVESPCSTSGVSIVPAAASAIVVTGSPSDVFRNDESTMTIGLRDAFGNAATQNSSAAVTFTPTGSLKVTGVLTGTGDGSYQVVGGAETVTVSSGVASVKFSSAMSGTYSIAITNGAGLSNPANESIEVTNPVTVTGVLPRTIPAGVTSALTVYGSGFFTGASVTVNGSSCASVVVAGSGESLTCVSPSLGAGTYSLVVTNADASTETLASALTYVTAPTVTLCSPATGQSSTVGAGTLYDSGGAGAAYGASQNCTMLITAPVGQPYTALSFSSFDLESGYDYLKVYDGTSAAGTALHTGSGFTGTSIPSSLVSSSGNLFLQFTSDSIVHNAGFAATWKSSTLIPPPTSLSYSATTLSYNLNAAITPVTPVVGGGRPTSYSVSPALPAGLTLSSTTGVLSGTPTEPVVQTTYTVTGSNAHGSVTGTFVMRIGFPYGMSYVGSPFTFAKNSAISPKSPTVSGSPTTFSVSPALPTGLSIDANTGVISGTPTTIQTATNYTVTASNTYGSTTANVSIRIASTPTILGVSPGSVPASTTAAISVVGTEFASGATVTVGGSACTGVSVSSDKLLTCTAPSKAAGAYSVVVTNADTGSATLASALNYETPDTKSLCVGGTSLTSTSGVGTLYDSGGAGGSYANSENCTLLITAPSGQNIISLTFSAYNTEAGWDYLKVYDGTSATGRALHTGSGFNGTSIPSVLTAASGSMFIHFTSDSTAVRFGKLYG